MNFPYLPLLSFASQTYSPPFLIVLLRMSFPLILLWVVLKTLEQSLTFKGQVSGRAQEEPTLKELILVYPIDGVLTATEGRAMYARIQIAAYFLYSAY